MDNELKDVEVWFGKSGGITLSLPGYTHYYDGYDTAYEQAAEDFVSYLLEPDTVGWEGNEPLELDDLDDAVRLTGTEILHVQMGPPNQMDNIDEFVRKMHELLTNRTVTTVYRE